MKPLYFFLLLTCMLSLSSCSLWSKITGGITHAISDGFSSIGSILGGGAAGFAGPTIEKVQSALESAMDHIFDTNLKPLLQQVDAAIERNMGQINSDIQNTIDHINQTVFSVIQDATNQAIQLVNFTLEEIKQKIIDEAFNKMTELETKVVNDLMVILNQIDKIVYDISCAAQGLETKVREDLSKVLPTIPNPFDSCRIQLNNEFPGHSFLWKMLKDFSYNELYEFRKCKEFIELNENSPIKSILLSYRDMENLAAEMRCLCWSLGATENIKYYLKEMAETTAVIELYNGFIDNGLLITI